MLGYQVSTVIAGVLCLSLGTIYASLSWKKNAYKAINRESIALQSESIIAKTPIASKEKDFILFYRPAGHQPEGLRSDSAALRVAGLICTTALSMEVRFSNSPVPIG